MSDYFQLKNSSIFTPPAYTDLGTNSNQYANAYISNNLTLGGTTVNGTTISTPRITGVVYPGDDQALDILGGSLTINGTGFQAGCQVLVNQTVATSVTFVSSTQVIALLPATPAGSYIIYVTNPDGSLAIRVNGVTFSGLPQWNSSSPLPEGVVDIAISIQLSATPATSYVLTTGYSLPPGLTLSSGGLLSGTVTGLSSFTTYNFNVTAIDAEAQDSPKAFAISINIGDPYFRYTTLLLNGENPAVPFMTDASYNNFLVSPTNGAAVPSIATPFQAGYYSTSFNGSTDYNTIPSETCVAFGSSAYTVEFWIYKTSLAKAEYIIGGTNTVFQLGINTSGQITPGPAGGTALTVSTGTVPLNQWVHVAMVRTSTASNGVAYYINGVASGTATDANSYASTGVLNIGTTNSSTTYCVSGSISNLRVINGSAVYPSAFTPSTTPLTAITNTSLLTCQSYRFLDNSTNNFTLTAVGTPAISQQQPFTLPSTWNNFGSSYFDGNTALTTAANAAFNLSTGAPNFTIEFWLYVPTVGNVIYINKDGTSGSSWGSYIIQIQSANTVLFLIAPNSGSGSTSLTGTVVPNTWTHIAAIRNGANIQLYLNGILAQSATAGSMVDGGGGLQIGKNAAGTPFYAVGNMCNLRIVKGVAVYTGNFTPPSIAPLAITGAGSAGCYPNTSNVNVNFDASTTSLLTFQTPQAANNNIFRDSSLNNLLITRAGSPTQGSFSPFSQTGWSVTGADADGIISSSSADFTFGTGDWSVETFFYRTGDGAHPAFTETLFDMRNGDVQLNGISLGTRSDGSITAYESSLTTATGLFTSNSWNHVVYTRQSGALRIFVNGILRAYTGSYTSNYTNTNCRLKTGIVSGYGFVGYMSNARIVKGSVPGLYQTSATTTGTTVFAVPTENLTVTSQSTTASAVSLLTCQSNRFLDNSTATPKTLSTTGTPSVQAFSPFNPTTTYSPAVQGGSGYFNGTTDYLSVASNASLQFAGDFTIECWVYLSTQVASYPTIISNYSTFTTNGSLAIFANHISGTANKYTIAFNGTYPAATSTVSISYNAWQHVALVRSGTGTNNITLYVDGVANGSFTSNVAVAGTSNSWWFGTSGDAVGSCLLKGNVFNFRVLKGVAAYTGAFSPPIAPLQLSGALSAASYPSTTNVNTTFTQGQTSLLLNFTAGGVVDATAKNTIVTVGDARDSATNKKYSNGGLYFDGTGDYFLPPASQNFAFGTGDFTIETWIYLIGTTEQNIISTRGSAGVTTGLSFSINTSRQLYAYSNSLIVTTTSTVPLTTWTHVALVRSGSGSNNLTIYINGVSGGAGTNTQTFSNTLLAVGCSNDGTQFPLNAYLDDCRVTKYARYTGTFTPPTAPFPVR